MDSNLSQEVILKRGKTFKKILFCVDFSPFAELLLSCVEEYVNVGMKEIILLHVVEAKVYADYGEGANPAFLEIEREAQELLERLADRIDASRVQVRPMVKAGSAASVIADTAKEENVSLIFMGAHGKGFLDRFIIGSVSEKVLRLADRPVLIEQCRVRKAGNDYACEKACSLLFENILFANDFSEYSERIWPILADMANHICAPVTLLHVREGRTNWGWDAAYRALQGKAKDNMRRLEDLVDSLSGGCPKVDEEMAEGSPAPRILEIAAERNASLIVIGALGNRTVGTLLGGVAERVLRESERPVLVLKA